MLARVVQQPHHVVVIERVVRQPPGSAHAHESGGAKQAQLMRNRGFREAGQRGEVADAPLAVRQSVHEAHPRRIPEQFEDLGHQIDRRTAQKA